MKSIQTSCHVNKELKVDLIKSFKKLIYSCKLWISRLERVVGNLNRAIKINAGIHWIRKWWQRNLRNSFSILRLFKLIQLLYYFSYIWIPLIWSKVSHFNYWYPKMISLLIEVFSSLTLWWFNIFIYPLLICP